MTALQQQGAAAKAASRVLAMAGTARKNEALEAIAAALTARQEEWLAANAEDCPCQPADCPGHASGKRRYLPSYLSEQGVAGKVIPHRCSGRLYFPCSLYGFSADRRKRPADLRSQTGRKNICKSFAKLF